MDLRAQTTNWAAINADPGFQRLHRSKRTFLRGLMAFSVLYYFMLPVRAGYFPVLFKHQIWGPFNLGLAFALSEFVVAWGIPFLYPRQSRIRRHGGRHQSPR